MQEAPPAHEGPRASAATPPPPTPGQLVTVRQRRFVVTDVSSGALPASAHTPLADAPPQHLVSLTSVEDDGLGEELEVIWEIEPGARIYERATLPEVTGFDPPERLEAFLDAVRWGAIASADHNALHAPFRSGITIEDYQLDPVVRALQMPRVNLLIADDVGLGKTIETGLVIQELLLRHRARSVLVVCPAGLQIQWRDQMRDKFGLAFRIVDAELMRELRRRRGIHVNPWTHYPRLITSIDFLKRERPLRLFREVLPADGEAAFPRRFDVLVVDEAHNVAPSGRGQYAVDSLRTAAIRTLAPHFEHRLFLTATPHNGYTESFTALLELLDDQRFHRGGIVDRKHFEDQLATVMVRRLKRELPPRWDGTPRFAERVPTSIEVRHTDAEREAHANLREYTALRAAGARDDTERYATEFVLKLLKKRLLSCPRAFLDTLDKHEHSLREARRAKPRRAAAAPTALRVLRRHVDGVDEDFGDDALYEQTTFDAVDHATRLFRDPDDAERELLRRLRAWAEDAAGRPDTRAATLIRWLGEQLRPDGAWNDQRVIVFTEYRATQKWLHGLLAAEGFTADGRLETIYGGMDSDERERVKAAFQAAPDVSPVRILLATDAASEGIDLQNHCHLLIHYEIPWNPSRMEQRNGRIDRHGQRAEQVLVHHFVPHGFERADAYAGRRPGDLDGDLEFLMRAALKVDSIREDLGKVGPVIAEQVEQAMLGRRDQLDTVRAENAAAAPRRLLKLERTIRAEIERLHDQLHDSRQTLHLTPDHVREVVRVGLQLARQPALVEARLGGVWPDPDGQRAHCPVFRLPALRGSWARCLEGLEHPHTRAIRPIVFDHALAAGRDDVVLAHLNHPLVQMCLQLLRAEIWAPPDRQRLHRAVVRQVPAVALREPAVVAHARLVVLGQDSTRLHEELITAGGWLRGNGFKRFDRVGEAQTTLDAATAAEPPDAIRDRLVKLWPSHRDPLLRSLEARMKQRTAGLDGHLRTRENKEVEDITLVLTELGRTIERELAGDDTPQLALFTLPEREQLERNRAALQARADAIPAEIEREVQAIRARYAAPTSRLFPVAVTYLVPEGLR